MDPKNQETPAAGHLPPIAEIQRLAATMAPVKTVGGHYAPVVLVPEGYKLEVPPQAQLPKLPDHIRQKVKLCDAASFNEYVSDFITSTTRVFADKPNLSPSESKATTVTAVIDYHDDAGDASTCAHVVEYPVSYSLEFQAWKSGDGKALSQMDFMRFIEMNCADVQKPSAAELMELALNFEMKMDVQFQSKVDRTTGGKALRFTEVMDAQQNGGSIKVPEKLELLLPIFEGGKLYPLDARLEYRARDGKLAITYHLQRPHNTVRIALKEVLDEISTKLKTPVLFGALA